MSGYKVFTGSKFKIFMLKNVNDKIIEDEPGFITKCRMEISGDGVLKAYLESLQEDLSQKTYCVIDIRVNDGDVAIVLDEYTEKENG